MWKNLVFVGKLVYDQQKLYKSNFIELVSSLYINDCMDFTLLIMAGVSIIFFAEL